MENDAQIPPSSPQNIPAQEQRPLKKSLLKVFIIVAVVIVVVIFSIALFYGNTQSEKTSSQPNQKTTQNNPSWVNDFIKREQNSSVANPPASLIKCTYKKQTVYYIPPRCCDISGQVYNEKGEAICSPDGGFTGRGDGKCTDFLESKTNCSTVWKDPR